VEFDMSRIELQSKEFDALTVLAEKWSTLRNVAVVDDDYPEYRHYYESALRAFMEALAENGRTLDKRFDFLAHLQRQRAWSEKTFGPGERTEGVIDHIRKELTEIEANPADVSEWIDVVILALDGAWRSGWEPCHIIAALIAKQERNEKRQWPDWRTAAPGKAIEHVR
jgi:hypothetical protein